MTCQLALSSKRGAVLFSDSQLSTDRVEYHGEQKQFVGDDFLLGGAGLAVVMQELFKSLNDRQQGQCMEKGPEIGKYVTDFLRKEVTGPAAGQTSFVLVYQTERGENVIEHLQSAIFHSFRRQGRIFTLGSGAALVQPAIDRDAKVGVFLRPEQLGDMMVVGEGYLEAAGQSLTVDGQFVVGLLRRGKAYVMGDAGVKLNHAPKELIGCWEKAARQYAEIMACAQTIREEVRTAQRAVAVLQTGRLEKKYLEQLEACRLSVQSNRDVLQGKLNKYCQWYDGVLGRGTGNS